PAPGPEIMVDRLVRRKVRRKHPPLAPAPQAVEDGIEHLAHVGGARAATRFGHGNERRQDGPFRISEICWIALHHPVPSSDKVIRGLTYYHAGHFSDRLLRTIKLASRNINAIILTVIGKVLLQRPRFLARLSILT